MADDFAARVASSQPAGLEDSDARLSTVRMSDEDRANLSRLQAQAAAESEEASRPTEENFTHHHHLADGRVVKARSGSGTTYSEMVDDGQGGKVEKFTPVIGIYGR